MTDQIRRLCAALLRWGRMGPPPGHMDMLRGEVGRRENQRLSHGAATAQRQASTGEEAPDVED